MPKAIDLTPKRAATFGKLLDTVTSPAPDGQPGEADPLRQIGNAAFRGLLSRMEQGEFLMPTTNGGNGTTHSLKDVVETVDKIDELRTRGEDRLARRLNEAEARAEKAEQALAKAQDGQMSGMGAIVQAFTTALASMQQQTMTILQNQFNQTLQIITELRQSQGGASPEQSWFSQIGREAIEQALKRDPLSDWEKVSAALDKAMEKHLGHQRPNGMDPQTLAAYLSYDLEKFKTSLEAELRREGLRRSEQISEQIAEYLGRAAREKADQATTEEGAAPRRPTQADAATPRLPEVYTYRCGACGEDFTLRRYSSQVICPHCGARLVTQDGRNGTASAGEEMTPVDQSSAREAADAVAAEPATQRAGGAG